MTRIAAANPAGVMARAPPLRRGVVAAHACVSHVGLRQLAAGAALALVLGLANCTAPPGSVDSPGPVGSTTTDAVTDPCPDEDTFIERVSVRDGQEILPLIYRSTPKRELCLVSVADLWTARTLFGQRFFKHDEPNITTLGHAVAELFPLQVGNRSSASVTSPPPIGSGPPAMWTYDFEAIGTERINSVETVIVLLKERGHPNGASIDTRVWIEPRLRIPMRVRYTVYRADNAEQFGGWDTRSVIKR